MSEKVKPKKARLLCAIMFDHPTPCHRCKVYKECPLDSHQKQGIMAIVRDDPASVIAWMRPSERARVVEELGIMVASE